MKTDFPYEVLSPAGDFAALAAAVRYGADAVYLGGKAFGMRTSPQNFTKEQLGEAVRLCHQNGVKLYVTCNTLPKEEEIQDLPGHLADLADAGVDALIVADMGVLALCKKLVPDMPIHISTQTGVVNSLAATALYELGASRVVLARELSLGEIAAIRKNTPPELELEAFVHGAMCMSVSGRCVLSNYLTGRDANRGDCAQPCRWRYALMEETRPGQYFPVAENEEGGSYILNAKDLNMIEHLDKLAQAGVSSFKIEGRAKSFYYTASTTHAYRHAVDILKTGEDYTLPAWVREETEKISHRPYSTGFYFGTPSAGQCTDTGGYIRGYEVAGVVEGYEDGRLICTQRNRFFAGDELEVLSPNKPPFTITAREIFDENDSVLDAARHAMQRIKITADEPLATGSILRKRVNPDENR